MSTFREKTTTDFEDMGMTYDQVKEVLERVISIPEYDQISKYLDRDIVGYPEALYRTTLVACRKVALDYIDETVPHAWFRSLFV